MIRKATAKRSEANAAVCRRSAGLDQRFKMSASVAGFPSINAATACLSFFVRSRRRALRAHSVLQLLQILIDASQLALLEASMSRAATFAAQSLLGLFTLPFEPLQPQSCLRASGM